MLVWGKNGSFEAVRLYGNRVNRFAGLGAFLGAVGLSRVVNYRNRKSEVEKVPDRVRRQIVDTREDYRVPRGYVAPLDLGNTGVTRFVIRAALGQEVS
ncbi:hypothetical protein H6792_00265 [Candidatus Nomurabacteria bacterium]|nr:hypothetical protein [Candidatus Nomurabacteria bacterium]